MRTTVRVDDELFEQLKARAHQEKVSLSRLLNRTLKAGLQAAGGGRPGRRATYKEKVQSLGQPRVALDKALALAATIEDEEIVRKLAVRK